MNESQTATGDATTAPGTGNRRHWSPLAALFVFAVAALAIQYVALLVSVLVAELWHQPFSFHFGLGPLEFWQANYHESWSNPEPGRYIGDMGGEAVIREGALVLAIVIGALAAIVQTRRVPAR